MQGLFTNRIEVYNELEAIREKLYRQYGSYEDGDRVMREILKHVKVEQRARDK